MARGIVYRFLAACHRYPDGPSYSSSQELARSLPMALSTLEETGSGFRELLSALETGGRAAREEAHVALFGHSAGGGSPPYETEYGESDERLLQPHEIADLVAFYRAYGLAVSETIHERADHISVECEFAAFLSFKEAHAEETGDTELAKVAVEAQKKFLKEHLGRWAPAFASRLAEAAGGGFHTLLAEFTRWFLDRECRRLEVSAGPLFLDVRPPAELPEECMNCPLAAAGSEAPFSAGFAPE